MTRPLLLARIVLPSVNTLACFNVAIAFAVRFYFDDEGVRLNVEATCDAKLCAALRKRRGLNSRGISSFQSPRIQL